MPVLQREVKEMPHAIITVLLVVASVFMPGGSLQRERFITVEGADCVQT